jgi:hypothetical protein
VHDVMLHEVRLFSSLVPFSIRFAFLMYAVEVANDVNVKRAAAGYCLSAVTATTCGYRDELVIMKHGLYYFHHPR